jgi:hypothetical protein
MISEQVGAVKEMQNEAINAFRCPCFNHAVNLSISKSSNVQSIRNSIVVIKEVISFFNMSAKRMFVLENICGGKLKKLCETRWVERIESIADFLSEFGSIVEALDNVGQWKDESGCKAQMLCKSLLDVEFLVSLHSQVSVLYLFLPLSNLFQKKTIDAVNARQMIKILISTIKNIKKNCDEEFSSIFKKVSEICEKFFIDIKVPRQTKRQVNRANVLHSNPSDYFKKTIYIPMLDNILMDLNDRFSDSLLNFLEIDFLIPKNLNANISNSEIKKK